MKHEKEEKTHAHHAPGTTPAYADAPAPEYADAFTSLLSGAVRATPEAAAFALLLAKPIAASPETAPRARRVVRKTWCVECGDPRCSVSPVTKEFEVDA